MKQRVSQLQIHSPRLRTSARFVLTGRRPTRPGRNKLRPSRCRAPRAEAARVHCTPGPRDGRGIG